MAANDDAPDQSGGSIEDGERGDGSRLLLQAVMEEGGELRVHTPMFTDPEDITLHVAAWRVLSRSLGQEICLRSNGRVTEKEALRALVDELKDEMLSPSAEIDSGAGLIGLDGQKLRLS
jgi:hypothetical protein